MAFIAIAQEKKAVKECFEMLIISTHINYLLISVFCMELYQNTF